MERLEDCLKYLSTERDQAHPELPFPHSSRWCPFDEWEEMGRPEDLYAKYELETEQPHHGFGLIVLSSEGRGMLNLLVINGVETGNVWKSDLGNSGEIYPLCLDTKPLSKKIHSKSEGERISFLDWLDWYEHWLE
ncbi:MAG TPA: hypothetical protein VM821_05775 [Abditibacteriaceae bacterium]|jgi:hypothetical protein|nr:hypothetical protein [Abditibacteriaceae bacterium]